MTEQEPRPITEIAAAANGSAARDISAIPRTASPRFSRTAGQHRTPRLLWRPIRTLFRKRFFAGLIVVRAPHDIEQFVNAGVVTLFCAIDHLLREIVAQHVARIRRVHARRGW